MGVWAAVALMACSFALLAKCADWLVEGAIEIARYLNAPPMLIGIVIVPELVAETPWHHRARTCRFGDRRP